MKNLLFITSELPFPPQSGGKVKTLKMLQALSKRYRITLACPLKLDDADHLDAFKAVSPCVRHITQSVAVTRSAGNLIKSYLRGVPLNTLRTSSAALRSRIAAVADEHDVVLLDHFETAPYLPESYKGLVLYHAHNAYFKLWDRFAAQPGNPALRLAAKLESIRVRRAEVALSQRADLVFAAPNDAAELVRAGAEGHRMHDTYHLGDDSQLNLPRLRFEDTQKKLMYVGFLGWEANVQGLLWFIQSVWPVLVRRHRDLRFDIVGKNPDDRLVEAVRPHPGIRLRGFVEDLETVYHDSRVSVAPLLFGSGMKVKVLDAMARGMPVVTTDIGAEGIDIVNGAHMLVENDPHSMAMQIDRLLTDPGLWEVLNNRSRQLIADRYTWARLFEQMILTMEQAISARSEVRTARVSIGARAHAS